MGLTGILHGSGHLIVGNHWFQGDEVPDGPVMPGMVFTYEPCVSVITGNYIDNCFIEWTNEHDHSPDFGGEYSFGGLTVTGNIFLAIDVAAWTNWIVIKPYGTGHYLTGMHVNENTFYAASGAIDRVEGVDDTFAGLDYWSFRNITFERNTFHGVTQKTLSPVTLKFQQNTNASTWTLDPSGYMPFGGNARTVTGVVAEGAIQNSANDDLFAMPYTVPNAGGQFKYVQLKWPETCHGTVQATVRVDKPI